jgi:hypothetical protein
MKDKFADNREWMVRGDVTLKSSREYQLRGKRQKQDGDVNSPLQSLGTPG